MADRKAPTNRSMLKVGMWNTNRKSVVEHVTALAVENNLNILLLLEFECSIAGLLETLAEATGALWYVPRSFCARVKLITRFPDSFVIPIRESEYYSVRRIALPGLPDVLLAAAHMRSRLRQAEKSQVLSILSLVDAINAAEAEAGHTRTLVAGDFNMDPYDDGMLGAAAMHAMMTRRTALRGSRTVERRKYRMFYNPMWSHLGDRANGPPGTYRYWSSEHICREWHAFDQVLLRPNLVDLFPVEQLRILTQIGSTHLLTSDGIPTPSDHLPLVFEMLEPGVFCE